MSDMAILQQLFQSHSLSYPQGLLPTSRQTGSYLPATPIIEQFRRLLQGLPLLNHELISDVVLVDIADVLDSRLSHLL